MNGKKSTIENSNRPRTDVRDIALAHLLVLEKEEAKGRYLCIKQVIHDEELAERLKKLFPECDKIPTKKSYEGERDSPFLFKNEKLLKLGFQFTDIDTTLRDSVTAAIEQNFLPKF